MIYRTTISTALHLQSFQTAKTFVSLLAANLLTVREMEILGPLQDCEPVSGFTWDLVETVQIRFFLTLPLQINILHQ